MPSTTRRRLEAYIGHVFGAGDFVVVPRCTASSSTAKNNDDGLNALLLVARVRDFADEVLTVRCAECGHDIVVKVAAILAGVGVAALVAELSPVHSQNDYSVESSAARTGSKLVHRDISDIQSYFTS